jgi:hypothetical protein
MMKIKTAMTGIMMSCWLVIGLLVLAYFSFVAGSTVLPFRQSNFSTTIASAYQYDNDSSPTQRLDVNNEENSIVLVNDQTLHGIVDWMKNERQALDEEFWKSQNNSKGYRRKLQTSTGCATTKTQIVTSISGGVRRITVCATRTTMGGAARRRNLKESDNGNHHRELSGGGINLSNRKITFVCVLKRNQRCILDAEGNSRLFYGTNTQLRMTGFVLFNASSDDKDMGGSALSFFGSSKIELYKTTVSHNNAQLGGAIMLSNSSLRTGEVQFQDNVGKVGGALYIINSNLRTAKRGWTQMLRNHAVDDGGAIYMIGGLVLWQNIFMSSNTASNSVSICIMLLFLVFTDNVHIVLI